MPTVLLVHIWLTAAMLPLLVRFAGLSTLLRLLTPRRTWYRGVDSGQVIEAVRRRLRNPRNMRRRACLREGLLMFYFLRLCGCEPTLIFSLYPAGTDDRMHGHCWVCLSGRCVSTPASPGAVDVLVYRGSQDRSQLQRALGKKGWF